MSAPRAPLVLLGALALAAGPALAPVLAAEPRSAIPWLSQSIEDTQPPPSRPPAGAPVLPGETITVRPLPALSRDGIGLLDPAETGFAPALWGPDDAAAAQALVLDHRDDGVPAARALFHRLLLADTQPPAGAGPSSALLVARVDRLLEAGDLDARRRPHRPRRPRHPRPLPPLVRHRPPPRPRRPGLHRAPPEPLAVADPAGAGLLPRPHRRLERRRDHPHPRRAGRLDRRRPAGPPRPLPRPGDLRGRARTAGPRAAHPARLPHARGGRPRPPAGPASPRLPPRRPRRARADARPRRRRRAADGLGRARARRALRRLPLRRARGIGRGLGPCRRRPGPRRRPRRPAARGGNGLADALAAADAALADRGLRVAFAEAYAPALAALDPAALPPEARARLSELLLLAGDVAGARHAAGAEPDARTAALLALADGAGPAAEAAASPDDPRLAAAIAGLAASEPADERERGLAADVASGRQGRAIVAALDLLVPGGAVDPPSLRAAILTLRLAGQDEAARTIAIETLLAGQPG